MNTPNDPLRDLLHDQPKPVPRANLAAQIIRQASALPQRQPWYRHVQRALDELTYGWHIKLASLALCGLLGVYAGQEQAPGVDYDYLFSAQALEYTLYPEDL
jgi:hypothetical protein